MTVNEKKTIISMYMRGCTIREISLAVHYEETTIIHAVQAYKKGVLFVKKTPYINLDLWMKRNGVTKTEIAQKALIQKHAFLRKFYGITPFSKEEAKRLSQITKIGEKELLRRDKLVQFPGTPGYSQSERNRTFE